MNIFLILVILLAGSAITFLAGDKLASKVALFFSAIAALFAGSLYFMYSGVETFQIVWVAKPLIHFSLLLDGLSLLLVMLNTFLTAVLIFAIRKYNYSNAKTLYSLILLMSFAMTGVFLSSDALLYYVFWELSLIPIYFIIVIWGNGEKEERRKSAITFFIYTFAGSLFMLASILYLYAKTGSFLLEDFYNANLTDKEQIWVFLGFMAAYAIKIPIFPFHSWQPSVYQKAPMVGTILLGGLMSKMGLFSIIRWQLPVAPYAAEKFQTIILILCIIGVIYGSILALRQDNIKRFIAYASLAHVGVIAAGAYSLSYDGILGAVFLIVAHAFGIATLFYSAEIIYQRTGTARISEMGGFRASAPFFSIMFLISVLAAISLPLSLNFLGEFAVMYGLYELNIWYSIGIGLSMFLGAFYMLRMYQHVMLGELKSHKIDDLKAGEYLVYALLMVIIIFNGFYSTPLTDLVKPSLENIVMYINR